MVVTSLELGLTQHSFWMSPLAFKAAQFATVNCSDLCIKFLARQVQVAEFQSEVVRCTVSGSGFPGLARQRQLAGLTAGLSTTLPEEAPLWGKAETGRLPKGLVTTGKGGAGASPCCLITLSVYYNYDQLLAHIKSTSW